MDGAEDWLFRPIRAQLIGYDALDDPRRDLEDFLLLNEVLDVETENQWRARKNAQGR